MLSRSLSLSLILLSHNLLLQATPPRPFPSPSPCLASKLEFPPLVSICLFMFKSNSYSALLRILMPNRLNLMHFEHALFNSQTRIHIPTLLFQECLRMPPKKFMTDEAIAAAAAVTPTAERQERQDTTPKKPSPTGPPPKKKLGLNDTVREWPSVSFFVFFL